MYVCFTIANHLHEHRIRLPNCIFPMKMYECRMIARRQQWKEANTHIKSIMVDCYQRANTPSNTNTSFFLVFFGCCRWSLLLQLIQSFFFGWYIRSILQFVWMALFSGSCCVLVSLGLFSLSLPLLTLALLLDYWYRVPFRFVLDVLCKVKTHRTLFFHINFVCVCVFLLGISFCGVLG